MEILIIGIIAFIIILLLNLGREQPYTDQEWDDQLNKYFEKYGPLPDDIDNNETKNATNGK